MDKWKIRYSTIDIVLLCISFYEVTGIPHTLFLGIKYAIILYLFTKHCFEYKKMRSITAFILLYGGVIFISTLMNQNMLNRYVASFVYMLHIMTIYVTIYAFVRNRGIEALVRCLILTLIVFALFTDSLMLFVSYNFSSPSESYLIGNKFAVSYLHCFITALLYCCNEKNAKKRLRLKTFRSIFCVASVLVCMKVTCTTGMLICLLMGAMNYFPIPLRIRKVISNPKIIVLVTAVINVLMLGSTSLLTNPYIADFISNVLGKSYTWVGRLHIYAMIFDVIKIRPWMGYGYFSNIIEKILGFGNAQNGVLKIIIDYGIIGLIGYTLLAYRSMKSFDHTAEKIWSMAVFVYCMIFASIAEINLTDYLFFLTSSIIFASGEIANFKNCKHHQKEGRTLE